MLQLGLIIDVRLINVMIKSYEYKTFPTESFL